MLEFLHGDFFSFYGDVLKIDFSKYSQRDFPGGLLVKPVPIPRLQVELSVLYSDFPLASSALLSVVQLLSHLQLDLFHVW